MRKFTGFSPTLFSSTLKTCFAILILSMSLASIHPLDFPSYSLHQAGTLICMGFLVWLVKKAPISDVAIIGATGFLLVHILGARYLYSYTPYSEWTQAVFGFSLDTVMGWQRNMYDRLVHFCYGLLLFPLLFDVLKFYFPHSSRRQIVFLVILLNMATSMFYELFEWLLAMTMSAEDAENYNGQQGDMWDAHKDMSMALLGAVSGTMIFRRLGTAKNLKKPALKMLK